jgi:hypothetical protein
MRTLLLLAAVVAAAGACRRSSQAPDDGLLAVDWRGAHTGHFSAPLTASHCEETGILELLAVRGDSGFGLVLFPSDSARVAGATYPIFLATDVTAPRPGANAALRWFTGSDLAVFEGRSGSVMLTTRDSSLSATLELRMHALSGTDSLVVRGRFDNVRLRKDGTGCGSRSRRNLI